LGQASIAQGPLQGANRQGAIAPGGNESQTHVQGYQGTVRIDTVGLGKVAQGLVRLIQPEVHQAQVQGRIDKAWVCILVCRFQGCGGLFQPALPEMAQTLPEGGGWGGRGQVQDSGRQGQGGLMVITARRKKAHYLCEHGFQDPEAKIGQRKLQQFGGACEMA
jgi:hypothetical protein